MNYQTICRNVMMTSRQKYNGKLSSLVRSIPTGCWGLKQCCFYDILPENVLPIFDKWSNLNKHVCVICPLKCKSYWSIKQLAWLFLNYIFKRSVKYIGWRNTKVSNSKYSMYKRCYRDMFILIWEKDRKYSIVNKTQKENTRCW